MPEGEKAASQPVGDLLANLVQASYNNYADTTRQLLDNLEAENTELRATLNAIRGTVSAAFSGRYLPAPNYVLDLLWPSREVVDQFREAKQS